MSRIQQVAPAAAFLNAIISLLTLFVAVVLIGPAAMTNRQLMMELALHSPAPLIFQDLLKFVSVALALVLIAAIHLRLSSAAPKLVWVATGFGLLSVVFLLANATLSLTALSQAPRWAHVQPDLGARVNALIGILGFAAIVTNGPWYLLMSWTGLKTLRLPKHLSYLGLVMGALSFVPLLGIIVLILSIIWWTGLGAAWLRPHPALRDPRF